MVSEQTPQKHKPAAAVRQRNEHFQKQDLIKILES